MGGCCSKDSDGSGKAGILQEIGSGDEQMETSNGMRAPPQSASALKRRRDTPSYKEQLVVLHSSVRNKNSTNEASSESEGSTVGSTVDVEREVLSERKNHAIYLDKCDINAGSCDVVAADESLQPQTRFGRNNTICATPLEIDKDFIAPVFPKTDDEAKFIETALEENFVFANIGDVQTKMLVDAFSETCVPKGTEVIRQGEVGDYFYLIEKGTVSFKVDGNEVGTADDGDSFGELSLLYSCPRAATCVTTDNCVFWRVDQKTFRMILASEHMKNHNKVCDILREVPFLKDLDDMYLSRITEALATLTYKPGERIIRKGDEGCVFYVVKSGKVKVSDIEVGQSKYADSVFGPGGYFGERSIVTNEKRVANVTAIDDVTLLCLSKADFNRVLGDFGELVLKTQDKRKLTTMPLFEDTGISGGEMEILAGSVKDVDYSAGHVFFTEGESIGRYDLALYLVRSGQITLTTSKGTIHNLTRGGYFGDIQLGAAQDGEGADVVAEVTAKVDEDCRVGVLALEKITEVLGGRSRLSKVDLMRSHTSLLDTSIKLEELTKHHVLGVGSFGKVWLVSRESEEGIPETFALKIQSKRDLIAHKQVNGVIREKNIMASIDSPFVIKLMNTYQDDKDLYMLIQLVQGGELFSILHSERSDGVPEKHAKFYAAGVFEGLAYMHQRHIVYRDLKPENVLIDKNGYTVIVDLGFAKIVTDKTYTLCGTPLYLAPEVILNRGHDQGADLWSWGVLIYEMNVGWTPFYKENSDQLSLLKRIVKGKYVVPWGKMSDNAKDLVAGLLSVQPINRIGCLAGADDDIRNHKWFKNFDFEKLATKELKAPWVPKLSGLLDSSNFDDWSYLASRGESRKRPLSEEEQQLFIDF